MKTDFNHIQTVTKLITSLIVVLLVLVLVVGSVVGILYVNPTLFYTLKQPLDQTIKTKQKEKAVSFWQAPDVNSIEANESGDEIRYGRELIVNTSTYLGPQGKVMHMSNGMNCQNCHLDAGTKVFGNNYSAVASTYPKFRARSGAQESIEKRVNDCFERSLNGSALPEDGKEMKAIVGYIKWLGKAVPKGEIPAGAGLTELSYLDRAADPVKGKILYEQKCSVCHGATGQGIMNQQGNAFTYPPLWGKQSYNNGAGLYRLSRFAGYIKTNMPLGATHNNPLLSDEEAWDIAAYVNTMDRPDKDISKDWPEIAKKPIDHPFGPFADDFSEQQHKFGPYKAIEERRKVLAAIDKIKK